MYFVLVDDITECINPGITNSSKINVSIFLCNVLQANVKHVWQAHDVSIDMIKFDPTFSKEF